jgi:hypothetical protein
LNNNNWKSNCCFLHNSLNIETENFLHFVISIKERWIASNKSQKPPSKKNQILSMWKKYTQWSITKWECPCKECVTYKSPKSLKKEKSHPFWTLVAQELTSYKNWEDLIASNWFWVLIKTIALWHMQSQIHPLNTFKLLFSLNEKKIKISSSTKVMWLRNTLNWNKRTSSLFQCWN